MKAPRCCVALQKKKTGAICHTRWKIKVKDIHGGLLAAGHSHDLRGVGQSFALYVWLDRSVSLGKWFNGHLMVPRHNSLNFMHRIAVSIK